MTRLSTLRVSEHVSWRRFDAELVVLDLKGGQYYGLNEVAAAVFEHVATGGELAQAIAHLSRVYDVDASELEEDVGALVRDLIDHGLLAVRTVG